VCVYISSDIQIAHATIVKAKARTISDFQSDVEVTEDLELDDSPWEVSSESDEDLAIHTRRQQPLAKTPSQSATLVSEIGDKQNSTTTSVELVQFVINCLWKLPIRRPAPLDRMKERATAETSDYYPFDLMHVKNKFPAVHERLAARLAKMITRRRQLMRYRKRHTDALQGHYLQTRRRVVAAIQDEDDRSEGSAPSLWASTRYTHITKATTLEVDMHARQLADLSNLYAPSIATSISSTGSNQSDGRMSINVPKRPKGGTGDASNQFICPYCRVAQSIATDRKWK
jgi:hypothetical protein